MSNVKISALPVGALTSTSEFPANVAGVTSRVQATFLDSISALTVGLFAQCRLVYTSSTTVTLQRFDGQYIPINVSGTWTAVSIPSAGVTLANAGLTAATLYYVYAQGSPPTLEASATPYTTDATTGIKVKTGDTSRTLVGMVYMGAGSPGTFVSSATQRWVRSWFNRDVAITQNNFTADRTITNQAAYGEINTEIRNELAVWSDEDILCDVQAITQHGAGGQTGYAAVAIDSTGSPIAAGVGVTCAGTNQIANLSHREWRTGSTEGYHYVTLAGRNDGNYVTTYWGITSHSTSAVTYLRTRTIKR